MRLPEDFADLCAKRLRQRFELELQPTPGMVELLDALAMPRCVVVEDSVAGIQAARAAGMHAIGFCGGSHCDAGHAARLVDSGAHVTCLSARALAELLVCPTA